jgi:hypothetical protein
LTIGCHILLEDDIMIYPRDKDGKLLPRPAMWTRLGPSARTKEKVVTEEKRLVEDRKFETASATTVEVKVPVKNTGRPVTTGKPWEAEGISRQAWYKRQKKSKGDV